MDLMPVVGVGLQVTGSTVPVTGDTGAGETKCRPLKLGQGLEAHVPVMPVPGASTGCCEYLQRSTQTSL